MKSLSPSRLERLRPYLEVLARAGLSPRLRRRVGPSDIVQETLIEAHRDISHFRGDDGDALLAWVRGILAHNIANVVRDHHRARRDVAVERSIDDALGRSSVMLVARFAASDPSPSEHAAAAEKCLRVAEAIASLPPDDQDVLILHYIEERSLRDIAAELGATRYAVTRTLRTALASLRRALEERS